MITLTTSIKQKKMNPLKYKVMKTNPNFKIKGYTVLLLVCMMLSGLTVMSQNPFASFELSSNVSGNGLGGNVCPSVALTYFKTTISVGPNFQTRKMNFSGAHVDYKYAVATNNSGRVELYFLGNVSYNASAHLSHTEIDVESYNHPEGSVDYAKLKLNVIEGYTGFGVRVNTGKNLSTTVGTALGMYHTLDKNYGTDMYRQRSGLVFQLQLGLAYTLKTNRSGFHK